MQKSVFILVCASVRTCDDPLESFNVFNLFAEDAAQGSACVTKNIFPYFSTRTYVVGTQKNRLNETVLLSTQNMYVKNWWVRNY